MSWSRRCAWVLALGLVQTCAYLALNQHPPAGSRELPLTEFERAIPFWPATVWAYFALLACELALPLCVRSWAEFRRLLTGYALAMGVAFTTYALFPTHYPRPPLPENAGVSAWAYGVLVALDTPECCLPSGHVIVPLLAAWSVARERRSVWPLLLVALLVPSVLTTKQHYVWDVAAGLALAAVAIAIAGACVRAPDERAPERVV